MDSQDNNSKSTYVALSHNVNNLVYHFVTPKKCAWIVFDESVEESLRDICLGIELRYDYIHFLEIGVDRSHVHFLVQSTPDHSPSKIIRLIESITARQISRIILKSGRNSGEDSFGPTGISSPAAEPTLMRIRSKIT